MSYPIEIECPYCLKYQLSDTYCAQCGYGQEQFRAALPKIQPPVPEETVIPGLTKELKLNKHTLMLFDEKKHKSEPKVVLAEVLYRGRPLSNTEVRWDKDNKNIIVPVPGRMNWYAGKEEVVILKWVRKKSNSYPGFCLYQIPLTELSS